MSQPGLRPVTTADDEWHVLQALWSRKDILILRGGPWVRAVSALVSSRSVVTTRDIGHFLQL